MVGKAQLVLVVGFALLLGGLSYILNRTSVAATYNGAFYYDALTSHNLAVSGAQAAIAKVEHDTSWFGSYTGEVPGLTGSYTFSRDAERPLLMMVISTYTNAVRDVMNDTVQVYFADNSLQSFSLMSWMTGDEGKVQWITGDSVFGKLHTNGVFLVNGTPVFADRVTTTNGFIPQPGTGTNRAIFQKGWQLADSIRFPDDLMTLYRAASDTAAAGNYFDTTNLWVRLVGGDPSVAGDGEALVSYSRGGPVIDSVPLLDNDNVIMCSGNVHVAGTLDGKLTVGSFTNVIIEDNILYERDPRTVPGSLDAMGLVAEDSVIVADNPSTADGCTIDGSIFARTGCFTAQHFDNGVLRGRLSVLGSIVQAIRGPVGTNIAGVPTSGYLKSYRYDTRLSDSNFRPPSYPGFRPHNLPIVGWWESIRVPDFSKYGL